MQGVGWLFSDDLFGDDKDRWRTASLSLSWIFGPEWQSALPLSFGEIIELRAYAEMISPEDLVDPDQLDRPYAGILALGAHTHFQRWESEFSMGLELVTTGPQNGVDRLQTEFHKLIGSTPPSAREREEQIPDGIYPTAVVETGRVFSVNDVFSMRPFGEVRIGDETLARIGADLTFGLVGTGDLLVRDKGTGHRYRTTSKGPSGFSALLGVDWAYVNDTVYIPSSRGLKHEPHRTRVRGGISWQGERASIFYGATYLSPEFSTQDEGQVIGSLNFKYRF